MEKLFEHYVAYHLRRNLPEYTVKTQYATEHICQHQERRIFKLKPDIFIECLNAKPIVMDTKWKLIDQSDRAGRYGLKDSDIQQMFAYSHYYLKHDSDVVLVYPYRKDKFTQPLDDFKFRLPLVQNYV
jgi:5-methylcytosine-specific restriction enzyme subunit McrC